MNEKGKGEKKGENSKKEKKEKALNFHSQESNTEFVSLGITVHLKSKCVFVVFRIVSSLYMRNVFENILHFAFLEFSHVFYFKIGSQTSQMTLLTGAKLSYN